MKMYRLGICLALSTLVAPSVRAQGAPPLSRAISKLTYQWGMLNRIGTAVWIDGGSVQAKGLHPCAQDAVLLTANEALLGAGLRQTARVSIPHEEQEFEESYLLEIQPTIKYRDIVSGIAVLEPTSDDWKEIKLLDPNEAPQCLGLGTDEPPADAGAKASWIPQFELSSQTLSVSEQQPGFIPSLSTGSVLNLGMSKIDKGLLGGLWIKGDAPAGLIIGQSGEKKAQAIGLAGLRTAVQAIFSSQFPGRRIFQYLPEEEEIAYEGLHFRQTTKRFLSSYGLEDASVSTAVYLSNIEPRSRYVRELTAVAPYSVYKNTRQIWWLQHFEQKRVTNIYVLMRELVERDRVRPDGINMEVAFLGLTGQTEFALFGSREKETLTLLRFQMPSIKAAYKNWIQNEYLVQHPAASVQAGTELVFYMKDGSGKVVSTLNPGENLRTVEANLNTVFAAMRKRASGDSAFTPEEQKKLVDLNRRSLILIAPFKDLQVYNLALNRDVEGRLVKLVQDLDLILKAREDATAKSR